MSKEMELNSVIFEGDFDNMKTALSRSILGVTYKKFKRKGPVFYTNKTHNEIVTKQMITKMYFELRNIFDKLTDYKIKINYILEWNENGKIISIKNTNIYLFIPVGELLISHLRIKEEIQPIKIELFYSDIDVSSKSVKKILDEIKLNYSDIIYQEYNLLEQNGKEAADLRNISLVPTVVIHDEIKLENPDKGDIEDAIKELSEPSIIADGVQFTYESSVKNNALILVSKLED